MQTLKIFQSLWGMEQRIPNKSEPSYDTQFKQIKNAGYHGVCLDPAVREIEENLALAPLFDQFQLECMVNAFPYEINELRPLLDMSLELNAAQVNIIGGVMPVNTTRIKEVVESWKEIASEYPFPVLFETHRNSTLNDLYSTLEVLDMVPDLRLCADLSHFVVDREFHLPIEDRERKFISRILSHSDSFQGRVASNEQIQIAINFPQHKEWVNQFKTWWREGICEWKKRSHSDATLNFLIELGPPPYAITDINQRELSDRWQEGLEIRSWIEEIWQQF